MSSSNARAKRLELILQAFIDLDKDFIKAETLVEYMTSVHYFLEQIMYAKNFYLALYDRQENHIQYVYDIDEEDTYTDPTRKFPLPAPEQSPTAWVIVNS